MSTWALMAMDILKLIIHLTAHGSPIQLLLLRMVCKRFRAAVSDVAEEEKKREHEENLLETSRLPKPKGLPLIYKVMDKQNAARKRLDLVDRDRRDFLDDCVKESKLGLLKWAIEIAGVKVPEGYHCRTAIHVGDIHVFEYLHSRGVPLGCAILTEASAFGHTHLIHWALKRLENAVLGAQRFEEERHAEGKKRLAEIHKCMEDITGGAHKERKRELERTNAFLMDLRSPPDFLTESELISLVRTVAFAHSA